MIQPERMHQDILVTRVRSFLISSGPATPDVSTFGGRALASIICIIQGAVCCANVHRGTWFIEGVQLHNILDVDLSRSVPGY